MNDIRDVTERGLCTQCGTCAGLCPGGAIGMQWHPAFGWRPRVEATRCTGCGVCLEVCPGRAVDFEALADDFLDGGLDDAWLGRHERCYAGYALDGDLRHRATSGGIVTTILLAACREGLVRSLLVAGDDAGAPLRARPFIAESEADIVRSTGAKYVTVPVNELLAQVRDRPGRAIVVGLPCHIHGLRLAQKKFTVLREKIFLCIGLFCGHNYLPYAVRSLLADRGIPADRVTRIRYRGEGWPGAMEISVKDGDRLRLPYPDYVSRTFTAFTVPRCRLCIDGTAELADISCGDAWLPRYRATDTSGTSVVVARTKQAVRFITEVLATHAHLEDISTEEAVLSQQAMLRQKKRIPMARINLRKLLRKGVPRYRGRTTKHGILDYMRIIKSTAGDHLCRRLARCHQPR